MSADDTPEPEMVIIYDGDCPFCSSYVRMMRLRQVFPSIEIINARDGGPAVEATIAQEFDLDEGMHLIIGETRYHGADCLHAIALLSSPIGVFNKLNSLVFRSKKIARWVYPLLRFCRNATLLFLGRRRISQTHNETSHSI